MARLSGYNNTLYLADIGTGLIRKVQLSESGVWATAFSRDSKTLAVGNFTEHCHLFDVDSGKVRATLPGHGEAARSVAFAHDGTTLAIGSYDSTMRLWQLPE